MSASQVSSSVCPSTPMDLAVQALAAYPCGFRGALPEQNVLPDCRCSLQVARGLRDEHYYCSMHHRYVEACLCNIRPTTPTSVRQWTAVCRSGVLSVPGAEWSEAYLLCTLPSSLKRFGGEICEDLQASNEGWRSWSPLCSQETREFLAVLPQHTSLNYWSYSSISFPGKRTSYSTSLAKIRL